LAAVLRSGVQLMESKTGGATEHERALFQINHVRVIEPSGAKSLLTADGARLFPPIHLIDGTGAVEVRMREKTALELSDLNTKEDFMTEAADGALNFAVLCSVRILVKKTKFKTNLKKQFRPLSLRHTRSNGIRSMRQMPPCKS
jgi:hypothetical protein